MLIHRPALIHTSGPGAGRSLFSGCSCTDLPAVLSEIAAEKSHSADLPAQTEESPGLFLVHMVAQENKHIALSKQGTLATEHSASPFHHLSQIFMSQEKKQSDKG